MSELDLGFASATPASSSTPGVPDALVLRAPAPVVVVQDTQAVTAVPVEAAKQMDLTARATAFVRELTDLDTKSPAFSQKVASITSMGERDMRAAAAVSSRMLERPAAVARGTGSGDAQSRVATTLADLRTTVTALDPGRADLTGAKKILGWLPGASKIDSYFARYQSAQSHLDAIIKALASGQDELRKDNAAIETEKANLWATVGRLAEYNTLAAALDMALEAKVAALEAAGLQSDADTVRADALFPVRQRRQDFMTQMAVSVQGYMALDLVRRNNLELIRGIDRAQTTTVAALRTAVIVSQALSRQRLVLDQITALNTATTNLIEATSQQLRLQGAQINEQAASATVDVAKLQAAFDNVFATMDALDTFRSQAVRSMAETVAALEGQIQRAQPYLERTRQRETSE